GSSGGTDALYYAEPRLEHPDDLAHHLADRARVRHLPARRWHAERRVRLVRDFTARGGARREWADDRRGAAPDHREPRRDGPLHAGPTLHRRRRAADRVDVAGL